MHSSACDNGWWSKVDNEASVCVCVLHSCASNRSFAVLLVREKGGYEKTGLLLRPSPLLQSGVVVHFLLPLHLVDCGLASCTWKWEKKSWVGSTLIGKVREITAHIAGSCQFHLDFAGHDNLNDTGTSTRCELQWRLMGCINMNIHDQTARLLTSQLEVVYRIWTLLSSQNFESGY